MPDKLGVLVPFTETVDTINKKRNEELHKWNVWLLSSSFIKEENMENIRLAPISSVENTFKDMIARSNQAITKEERERGARRIVLKKIQNAVSPEWRDAVLGISAEAEMKFWKKISRKGRNIKKHLTFDSSIEEVFAASPEEQDRWAEDIANRSNAFMAKRLEELRKREESSEKIAIGA